MDNVEENIKFIEKMIKEYRTFGDLDNPDFEETDKIYKVIENILRELKELNKTNNDLRLLYRRTAKKLQENGKEELADYLLAQIDAVRTFSIDDDIDYYKEYYKQKSRIKELEQENYVQKIELLENSIPKQKVKDKIEEINEDEESKYYDTFLDARDIYHAIKILEELLEDK